MKLKLIFLITISVVLSSRDQEDTNPTIVNLFQSEDAQLETIIEGIIMNLGDEYNTSTQDTSSFIEDTEHIVEDFHTLNPEELRQAIDEKYTPMLTVCPEDEHKFILESLGDPIKCGRQVSAGTNSRFYFANSDVYVEIFEAPLWHGAHKEATIIMNDLGNTIRFDEQGILL